MEWRTIALGGAIGLVAGALSAFIGSVLTLQMKQLRNGHLYRRGIPGIRDVALIKLHLPGAVLGLIIGAIASAFDHGDIKITVIAATAPWVLLLIVQAVFFTRQALE